MTPFLAVTVTITLLAMSGLAQAGKPSPQEGLLSALERLDAAAFEAALAQGADLDKQTRGGSSWGSLALAALACTPENDAEKITALAHKVVSRMRHTGRDKLGYTPYYYALKGAQYSAGARMGFLLCLPPQARQDVLAKVLLDAGVNPRLGWHSQNLGALEYPLDIYQGDAPELARRLAKEPSP